MPPAAIVIHISHFSSIGLNKAKHECVCDYLSLPCVAVSAGRRGGAEHAPCTARRRGGGGCVMQ